MREREGDHAEKMGLHFRLMEGILVICSCWDKLPQIGCLKQQKSALSQLWRLELRNPGVSRGSLPLKAQGRAFLDSPSFWGLLLSWLWQHQSSLGLCLRVTFSSVSVSISLPFSYQDLSLHAGCTLIQDHLILRFLTYWNLPRPKRRLHTQRKFWVDTPSGILSTIQPAPDDIK